MDEGDLPIQATNRHKGELTSHHILRMVMYYRLFHFRCTVAKPQHDLQKKAPPFYRRRMKLTQVNAPPTKHVILIFLRAHDWRRS